MSDWPYYNFRASRAPAAYRVPHTVAVTLTGINKKLPSAACEIYRGYYSDIIGSSARAQDSAIAMAEFAGEDFPVISGLHNRLANLMNPEIKKQKPGDEGVIFPVVGDGTATGDDDEDVRAGYLAQVKKRNVPKWQRDLDKEVVTPEDSVVIAPEPASIADLEPEMREESPILANPPTIANSEMIESAAAQSHAESPTTPTTLSSEDIEMDENDSDLSGKLPDAPQSAVRQSSATSPTSPTIFNNKHPDIADDDDYEMNVESLDATELWDDSLWLHGPWIDGLEVIDALPWARTRSL
jgi:hypothetical protein